VPGGRRALRRQGAVLFGFSTHQHAPTHQRTNANLLLTQRTLTRAAAGALPVLPRAHRAKEPRPGHARHVRLTRCLGLQPRRHRGRVVQEQRLRRLRRLRPTGNGWSRSSERLSPAVGSARCCRSASSAQLEQLRWGHRLGSSFYRLSQSQKARGVSVRAMGNRGAACYPDWHTCCAFPKAGAWWVGGWGRT
jgi:hypothetical protein